MHLQVAYLFAAGLQYFPFSTISYEFSQYAINSKHPIMCRDSQMELFAFELAADHEAVKFDKSGHSTWHARTRAIGQFCT